MPPKKQPQFDWIRLWPVAVVAVGALTGYVRLQSSVEAAEKKIEAVESEQKEDDKEYLNLQIQQTKIEGKVDQGYALLQEIRSEMKKK